MTLPSDASRLAADAATSAVTLSRLESLKSTVDEFRKDFQRFAERNGERMGEFEKANVKVETLLNEHAKDIEALQSGQLQSEVDRRIQSERLAALDSQLAVLVNQMKDIQEIKRALTVQVISIIVTVVVYGGLFAYVLLRP